MKKTFCAWVVTTNDFALNHAKSLQVYFCVKSQAKKNPNFPYDVKSSSGDKCGDHLE